MNENICVVYTHSKLGDLIWQLPYIKALSEYHKKKITIIVRASTQAKKILKDLDHFDNIEYNNLSTKIILYDNIKGEDLYGTIVNSSKVIAFHGMMTNLASINRKNTIDMWFCDIKNYNDYRNYRNAFYEFKPKYKGYNFIIPSKEIDKTIRKLSNFI